METPILIPYKLQKDTDELRLTLRSIERNADFNYRIVLLGDKPDWINLKTVDFEPFKPPQHPLYPSFFNTQQKTFHYIKKISEEDVIWTADDIIFNQPITLELLKEPVALERLFYFEKSDASKKFVETLMRTREVLLKKSPNKTLFNYCTHTPYLFNREKLLQLFADYNVNENIYNYITLYYNVYESHRTTLLNKNAMMKKTGIYTNESLNYFLEKGSHAHYINWGAAFWKKNLRDQLFKLFPKKSIFEK